MPNSDILSNSDTLQLEDNSIIVALRYGGVTYAYGYRLDMDVSLKKNKASAKWLAHLLETKVEELLSEKETIHV